MIVDKSRPWLAQYPPDLPADQEPDYANALEMFKSAVNRWGDQPALVYFDNEISYSELDELTDALASALLARGFSPGDRLALFMQNVPHFAIGMISAWKAGGAMVSVNPMLRHEEAKTILLDSGSKALITEEELWDKVAREVVPPTEVSIKITISPLDFLDGDLPTPVQGVVRSPSEETEDMIRLLEEHRGQTPPEVVIEPDDMALMTYTSGTTGPPKGAMNSHANVTFNAKNYMLWGDLGPDDRILAVAPLFHITGLVAHLAVGYHSGAPVLLFYRFDVDTALDLIERRRASFTVGSITVFIALMNSETLAGRDVSSFTKVMSGGAPIAPTTIQAFQDAVGAYIHNVYGLTETTSPSHFVPRGTRAPVDETSGALSVGLPVPSTMVKILDEEGNELEPGEIGEIAIKGPQVVSGYWRNAGESANAIRDGYLHTGDVGVMDSDGWFYVVDRKKDMINASGYKVWPREVEDVIFQHEAVLETAVVGVPDEYRGETVKAFVSLKSESELTEEELVAFCKERMAAYKYPRQVEFIDALPKTASGKVLRRELRDRGSQAKDA